MWTHTCGQVNAGPSFDMAFFDLFHDDYIESFYGCHPELKGYFAKRKTSN